MAVNGGTLESIVALESADPTAATTATASDVTTSLTVPVEGEKKSFFFFFFFLIFFYLISMNGQLKRDETLTESQTSQPAGPARLSRVDNIARLSISLLSLL
jgi:hypothetical protein